MGFAIPMPSIPVGAKVVCTKEIVRNNGLNRPLEVIKPGVEGIVVGISYSYEWKFFSMIRVRISRFTVQFNDKEIRGVCRHQLAWQKKIPLQSVE